MNSVFTGPPRATLTGSGEPLPDGRDPVLRSGLDAADPWAPAFYHYAVVEVDGRLDAAALQETLDGCAGLYPQLRRALVADGEGFRWQGAETAPACAVEDLSGLPEEAAEAAVSSVVETGLEAQGEPRGRSPLEVILMQKGERSQVLCLRLHCLAGDEVSLARLVGELLGDLPPGEASDGEGPAENRDHRPYWKEQLRGAPTVLELATDLPRPKTLRPETHRVDVEVASPLARRLRALALAEGADLEAVFLAAFGWLLARYTGKAELLLGAPSDRRLAGVPAAFGAWTRELPLRLTLPATAAPGALVRGLRESLEAAARRGDLDHASLVQEAGARQDASRRSLTQARLCTHRLLPRSFSGPGVKGRVLKWGSATCGADAELHLGSLRRGDLALSLCLRRDLFHRTTARRLLGQLERLLRRFVEAPSESLRDFDASGRAARHQLLVEWQGDLPRPGVRLLHQHFEAQARRAPEAIAVEDGSQRLSYGRLEELSRRLALRLRDLGAGPETVVGLLMDRSVEAAVAMLGILRSGAAYLPLDFRYPRERLEFMLGDARAVGVVTVEELAGKVPPGPFWAELSRPGEGAGDGELPSLGCPENLAYVIFTSGSTGRPKGVAVTHRSASRLLRWMEEAIPPQDLERVLASTSLCFDISVFETTITWGLGGTAVVVPDALGVRSSTARGVTAFNTVPSVMAAVLRDGPLPSSIGSIIQVGEALPGSLATAILEAAPGACLLNLYGPTEDTVYSTAARIGEPEAAAPAIGRPISGTAAYLARPGLDAVPLGAPGELLLAGEGLARGYLGRPGLTAERFVPNPYGAPGSRSYRTGDLARHRPDGDLEYLGRLDHQVKVRGFRIETGEVESRLLEHPQIREAVVTAWIPESGEGRLVAYLVAPSPPDLGALREFLGERLPSYMLPEHFVFLDELPLNSNGKVDRKALPSPRRSGPPRKGPPVAPRNPTEEALAEIWLDLMEVDEISVLDDFFDLGGNSLVAIHLVTRIRDRWGIELPMAVLFAASTLERIAAVVDDSASAASPILLPMAGREHGGPAFFCVHGIGGNLFRLVHLARLLGQHRSVYGLLGWAKLEDTSYLSSVEAMAERYLSEIEAAQPQGPLFLGGYSLGSLVAYEMARLARQRGRQVAFVGLLDIEAPARGASVEGALASLKKESYEAGVARELGIPISTDRLADLEPKQRLAYVLEEGKRTGALPQGFSLQDAFRFIEVYQKTALAGGSYGAKPYGGSVTLFSTADPDLEDPTRGWGDLVTGGVEIVPIEGSHFTMVYPPEVAGLAEALAAAMERAEERARAGTGTAAERLQR